MSHTSKADKIRLRNLINDGVKKCCEKYDESYWPIAVSIDIPNCIIKTGLLKEDIEDALELKEGSIITITSDILFYDKCDKNLIFIDDSYMIKEFKVGMEMSFGHGEIVIFCIDIVDEKTITCKVHKGGIFYSMDCACVRGVKHTKPELGNRDLDMIQFAKDNNADIITVHSVRKAETLQRIKMLLSPNHSNVLIFSTICEQEGLDNIDDIIVESDCLIFAREFISNEIKNPNQMPAIQMNVCAKCKKQGKQFFVSGHVLRQTLVDGSVSTTDVSDVTNALLQGAGFVLLDYTEPAYLLKAMTTLNGICKSVEPLSKQFDFWRLYLEFPIPVNAAEACVLSCALSALKVGANIIILPTVSGKTVTELIRVTSLSLIVCVTTNLSVAKRLRVYRSVKAIVYDKKPKSTFSEEMDARIEFAVNWTLKHNFVDYGHTYVALQRSTPASAYCDMVKFINN